MAKTKKVLGIPVGKKSSGTSTWVRGAAAVAGGAYAATRAIREIKGGSNGSSTLQKGKEAVGNAADSAKKLSSMGDKVQGGPLGKVASALGGSGGSDGEGKDKGRSGADQGHVKKLAYLIDEQIDVGVPRREAYNQWTQFEEFSEIFKGVENVDHPDGDDDKTQWSAKIGPSRRQYEAEITEQIPDRRIAWKAKGGANVQGVVTFHELDRELTRINVEMVYRPQGFVEHVGNWFRAARRKVRKDLKLFKNYIELRGEASGEWRGRISKEGGRGDAAVDGSPAPDESSDNGDSSSSRSSSSSGSSGSNGSSSKRSSSSSSSKRSSSSSKRSGSSGKKSSSRSSSGGSRSGSSGSRTKSSRSSSKRSAA